MRTLPLGTAYTVWTAIGALSTVTVGILALDEPLAIRRGFAALLIVAGLAYETDDRHLRQRNSILGTRRGIGWGGRIRTFTIRINSAVSYRLDHAPAGKSHNTISRKDLLKTPRLPKIAALLVAC
jgi:hypothetical protein